VYERASAAQNRISVLDEAQPIPLASRGVAFIQSGDEIGVNSQVTESNRANMESTWRSRETMLTDELAEDLLLVDHDDRSLPSLDSDDGAIDDLLYDDDDDDKDDGARHELSLSTPFDSQLYGTNNGQPSLGHVHAQDRFSGQPTTRAGDDILTERRLSSGKQKGIMDLDDLVLDDEDNGSDALRSWHVGDDAELASIVDLTEWVTFPPEASSAIYVATDNRYGREGDLTTTIRSASGIGVTMRPAMIDADYLVSDDEEILGDEREDNYRMVGSGEDWEEVFVYEGED
jgi:hypothetical protein